MRLPHDVWRNATQQHRRAATTDAEHTIASPRRIAPQWTLLRRHQNASPIRKNTSKRSSARSPTPLVLDEAIADVDRDRQVPAAHARAEADRRPRRRSANGFGLRAGGAGVDEHGRAVQLAERQEPRFDARLDEAETADEHVARRRPSPAHAAGDNRSRPKPRMPYAPPPNRRGPSGTPFVAGEHDRARDARAPSDHAPPSGHEAARIGRRAAASGDRRARRRASTSRAPRRSQPAVGSTRSLRRSAIDATRRARRPPSRCSGSDGARAAHRRRAPAARAGGRTDTTRRHRRTRRARACVRTPGPATTSRSIADGYSTSRQRVVTRRSSSRRDPARVDVLRERAAVDALRRARSSSRTAAVADVALEHEVMLRREQVAQHHPRAGVRVDRASDPPRCRARRAAGATAPRRRRREPRPRPTSVRGTSLPSASTCSARARRPCRDARADRSGYRRRSARPPTRTRRCRAARARRARLAAVEYGAPGVEPGALEDRRPRAPCGCPRPSIDPMRVCGPGSR